MVLVDARFVCDGVLNQEYVPVLRGSAGLLKPRKGVKGYVIAAPSMTDTFRIVECGTQ